MFDSSHLVHGMVEPLKDENYWRGHGGHVPSVDRGLLAGAGLGHGPLEVHLLQGAVAAAGVHLHHGPAPTGSNWRGTS